MPQPERVPHSLGAGGLTARLINQDLRYLRWDGEEFLNRAYLAVRDPAWATLAGEGEVTHRGTDTLEWVARYRLDDGDLSVRASLHLQPDAVVCSMTATAEQPVRYNRIGWCFLLPLDFAGSPARYTDPAGVTHRTCLPELIAPQPLGPTGPEPAIGPFSHFEYQGEQATYQLAATGDLFELEDQRNWTDASFKIYSTPLSLPRPHTLPAGAILRQEVRLTRVRHDLPRTSAPAPPARQPAWPRLSAVLTSASPADLRALASLGIETVRIETHPGSETDLSRAEGLIRQARDAGLGFELTLWCEQGTPWPAVRRLISQHRPELILVLPANAHGGRPNEHTPVWLADEASSALGRPVAGGTPFSLCELQRHPLDHLPVLTCTFTPTVHATDDLSVHETAAALPHVVRTLRALAPHAELALGPFQGRERAPSDPDGHRPSIAGLPPRWLTRSLASLAHAGVERLCVADLTDLVHDATPTAYGRAVAEARAKAGRVTPRRLEGEK